MNEVCFKAVSLSCGMKYSVRNYPHYSRLAHIKCNDNKTQMIAY